MKTIEPNDENDDEVIAAVHAGHTDAFATLVSRYQQRLFIVLLPLCHGPAEADELVQESFVRAFTRLDSFTGGQPFFPWLRQIGRNYLRDRRRNAQVVGSHAANVMYLQTLGAMADDAAEELTAAKLSALGACLQQVNQGDHELLRRRYARDLSIEALAQQCKIRPGALKMRLLRLRQLLRECIERRLAADGEL